MTYFPFNTARLDMFRRSPAYQVVKDTRRGGWYAIHTPIKAIVGGNTAS